MRIRILSIKLCFSVLFLFIANTKSICQWDPDAGLILPFTNNATITASSTASGSPLRPPSNIVDGDLVSYWLSTNPYPTEYVIRSDQNFFLGAAAKGWCTGSTSNPLTSATDGNLNTTALLSAQNNSAWFEIQLDTPRILKKIGVRVYNANVTIYAYTQTGNEVELGTISFPDNSFTNFDVPNEIIEKIRIISSQTFQIFEISALAELPVETITIDLGQIQDIYWIEKLNTSDMEVESIVLESSADGIDWTYEMDFDPGIKRWVKVLLDVPISARYFRFKHAIRLINYKKAFLYEVKFYGQHGPYSPPTAPVVNPHSMSKLLGINAYRHWLTSISSELLGESEGPKLFSRFASHGRSYQNWRQGLQYWNTTTDPLQYNPPKFEDGWSTGDIWNRDYQAWIDAGIEVEATIQFINSKDRLGNIGAGTLLESEFTDFNRSPIDEAYKFGQKFAGFFGPLNKNVVKVVEVGNEPWDYHADFYRDLLYGMAKGVKETDPNLIVLTCALNAHDYELPGAPGGKYIGARLSEREVPYIDALNIHIYSWMNDEAGHRIGIHPEHPESEFNAVRNMIRFRDINLPGMPIYVTEYGWDSDGAGQNCTHSECVSEDAQAAYSIRGTFILARLGIQRATYYNFTNDRWYHLHPNQSSLWAMSGVTGSTEDMFNLPLKKSFYAFESMVNIIGDRHFIDVMQEDEDAYVYLFGDENGTPTHLVAWQPIDLDRDPSFPGIVTAVVDGIPGNSWYLSGSGELTNGEPANPPMAQNGSWTFDVTPTPLVVEITTGPGAIAGSTADEVGPVAQVTIDLYNSENILINSLNTTNEGEYLFDEIDPGDYSIEMVTPIGYNAVNDPLQFISVLAATETVVDFSLERKDIVVDARGSGYWKHQVNSLIRDKGKAHETAQKMLEYLNDIKTFWDYFDNLNATLAGMQPVLDLSKKPAMKLKAEKELMSLLLNVTSEKIATFTEVSSDDNIGEALDYSILILENSESSDAGFEQIKDMCEAINNGNLPLDPTVIPEIFPKAALPDNNIVRIPTEFNLQQNYPNPFNPSTTIEFGLPEITNVNISVYDISGKLVKTLLNGQKAAGYHKIVWNAAEYSTGIYFVKMVSTSFTKSVKIALMK